MMQCKPAKQPKPEQCMVVGGGGDRLRQRVTFLTDDGCNL